MNPRCVHASLLVSVLAACGWGGRSEPPKSASDAEPRLDVEGARELDRQGVRAFLEGHYRDALLFFREAARLGGPPSEIWNMAKCHLKLDEPDQAAQLFSRVLHHPQALPEDRADARRELDLLEKRPSTVVIAARPSSARVWVDHRPLPRTGSVFVVVDLLPGIHRVRLERGASGMEKEFEVSRGRARILEVSAE